MSYHLNCANCGVEFCIPDDVHQRRREDHENFYCPSGHANHYPQETEKERRIRLLEREAKWLKSDIDARDATIERLEREIRSLRSKLAWARKRTEIQEAA